MSNSYFIALTLGMAAVTFLIRFSFIGLAGKIQMSVVALCLRSSARSTHRPARTPSTEATTIPSE
jgi:hypothetical protein